MPSILTRAPLAPDVDERAFAAIMSIATNTADTEFAAALRLLLGGANEFTVYRAALYGMHIGQYVIEADARRRCETEATNREPGLTALDWLGADEADHPRELVATYRSIERPTGYTVTPITVSLAYDAKADQ